MIGQSLGEYLIVDRLGRGGMGTVYRAESERGQEVALKVLAPGHADDPKTRLRFKKEVEVLQGLDEACIVRALTGLCEAEGQLFFAMELVAGRDLGLTLREDGPLPVGRALAVVDDVLRALAAAHGQGVLHRDVKPSNVFLTPSGTAKLGDFGLAHVSGASRLTRTGSVLGTPEYMAPEQAEGRDGDARTDVYAVGVLLHEVLSGEPPFGAPTPLAVLRAQVERPPPELPPATPASVCAIVARALRKDPGDRYATAEEMRLAVAEAAAGLTVQATAETAELTPLATTRTAVANAETRALSPAVDPVAAERERPRRPGVVLGVIAVVSIAGGLGWRSLGPKAAEPDPSPAQSTSASPSPSPLPAPTATPPGPPRAEERLAVVVELHGGQRFSARLVRIDLEGRVLVTQNERGEQRTDSLDDVLAYETVE